MKIGIAVFAYCRNDHLEQVLCGLKENKNIDKIYIFQDGLKTEEHRNGWEETTRLIEAIDWCEIKYIKAFRNRGLRTSIIEGINHVLQENDAIIAIEDDCVPTENFIDYMRMCLEKYEFEKRVWNVSGFARAFLNDGQGAYFSQKMEAWGWGTWKDRWEQCDFDKDYLTLLKSDRLLALKTNIWYGLGIENIFRDQNRGVIDTWDAWWMMCILEHDGLCLNPYKSYIKNIGFDGSGTNCGKDFVKNYHSKMQDSRDALVVLPEIIGIEETIKYTFAFEGTGSSLAYMNAQGGENAKKRALVYGVGHGLRKYENQIAEFYEVVAFVDRERQGFYAGKDIITPEHMCQYVDNDDEILILITLLDSERGERIKAGLVSEYKVSTERVIILSDSKR